MNEQQATMLIPAALHTIRSVLLAPASLPDWNPTIHTVGRGGGVARVGVRYPITATAQLSGDLEYTEITERRIGLRLQVQGLRETGWWLLTPRGAGTEVEHGFSHSGFLAWLLTSAYQMSPDCDCSAWKSG